MARNRYRVEVIRLKDRDADRLFRKLEKRVEKGAVLTRTELFPLLLTPLMSGEMEVADRICHALDLIQANLAGLKGEEQKRMEAVLYALAIKLLGQEELKKVKERIRMTLLGQMLREDGIAEGLERGIGLGIEKGEGMKLISQVTKKLQSGQLPAEIAKDLMEEGELIERIVDAIKANPAASPEMLLDLIKNRDGVVF